ncbi:hypothetical protein [Candidatus Cryosericum septentrionale]|jgi:hypothetical protein|uniref:HEPN domain-containing protein n=1 Tax=Candidatus Cryosericum septentrionale TaxID=2290913 RepID=A0A398DJP0_9BACT|nr:hypothetical protein [Candidatus Cryosericum septentrionale]RIE15886.1 hypothetical protein SMC1_09330 [Candidatus Cryosericum septentrionale]
MGQGLARETPDAKSVFAAATGFDESAALLHQANNRVLSGPQRYVTTPYLWPGVVCDALAVELYMKCLAVLERGDCLRTHSLRILFADLSPDSQAEIAQTFERLIAANPLAQAMKAQVPKVSFAIHDVLREMDLVFEQARYVYENQLRGAYGLGELAQAVRKRILELGGAA